LGVAAGSIESAHGKGTTQGQAQKSPVRKAEQDEKTSKYQRFWLDLYYQLVKEGSLFSQQGIQSENTEESAFDRRIKERIQKEEEIYEAKKNEARGHASDESDSDMETMDVFDKIANQEENAETSELEMKTLAIRDYQEGKARHGF